MNEILKYLCDSIDEDATIEPWDAKQFLNLQLAGTYDFYLVTILKESFLLIKPLVIQTIPKLKIHIDFIREKADYEVAVLLEKASSYMVKKMLEERMAFLAADKQMYLPFLVLHIKKQGKMKMDFELRDRFTPATQMVFLSMLYADRSEYTAEELARDLNISTMTVLRAMEEMGKIGVVRYEVGGRTGRKKVFIPISKKEYYHIGKHYLMNPVKKTIYVSKIPTGVKMYKSGLTALGEQTMLGEPEQTIYALYGSGISLMEYQVPKIQALLEKLPEIQIMQYDIGRLTHDQYVDPITLILSVGISDDRIEIAIDELMEGMEWYGE